MTVVVFLATECPISQKYIPLLNSLRKKYDEKEVNLRAVIPGRLKKSERKNFIRDYDLSFPLMVDKRYHCVRAVSAKVTPEVFVFDSRHALRYRGAIDNWFHELGEYRKSATENYLLDAVEALLAGRIPKTDSTNALGCYIQAPSR